MEEQRLLFLGVPVNRIDLDGASRQFLRLLSESTARTRQVVTVNPEFIMEAQQNAAFRKVLQNADISLADGVGLVLASWLLYGSNRRLHRVTGVQSVWELAKICAQESKRLYLLGAGEGVAAKAAAVLRGGFRNSEHEGGYPSLTVVGAEQGIFIDQAHLEQRTLPEKIAEENDALIARINAANPDVLLVAFGAPKQELWIAQNISKFTTVRIAIGIGGALDYISGTAPFAPFWVRNLGFEWLYRLIRQPFRINRIITATVRFPLAIIRARFL